MVGKHVHIALASLWLGLEVCPSCALGDGGTLRFSGRRGDYLVTVFTSPAPLCAGQADLSVLVQDAQTGRPITSFAIDVRAHRAGHEASQMDAAATTEAATNKLLRAAQLELPEAGRWHFEVLVHGVDRSEPIGFDVEVARPPPPWLEMIPWIAWPILPIGLYAIGQFRLGRTAAAHRLLRFRPPGAGPEGS